MLSQLREISLLILLSISSSATARPNVISSQDNLLLAKRTFEPQCRSISRGAVDFYVGTSYGVSPIQKTVTLKLAADRQTFTVDYPQNDGMAYTATQVYISKTIPTNPHSSSFPYSSSSKHCTIAADASTAHCVIPGYLSSTLPVLSRNIALPEPLLEKRTPTGCDAICSGWLYVAISADVRVMSNGVLVDQLAWGFYDPNAPQCIETLPDGSCVLQARWWQTYLYCD